MFIACQYQLCSASVHSHLVLLGTDSSEFSPHFPPGSFEKTADLSFGVIGDAQGVSVYRSKGNAAFYEDDNYFLQM